MVSTVMNKVVKTEEVPAKKKVYSNPPAIHVKKLRHWTQSGQRGSQD